ncbi:tetratricopeptide repeat protein [Defluviimonas sp. WL0024]|uniref:Tetratricopeptide repeat protein n=1 Tax=Albidovulum salinarum TaxID=2984153 RepID=A0ABT2X7X2_9RHOB|nr:tetratricopeptide repeat protein [Defluviimonas sp. WL0024]MCU9850034.1 tetratricopeptide repeat protein [Defluviimonas sp. WL0024]
MSNLDRLPHLLAARDWIAAERLLRRAVALSGAPASVFYNLAKVIEMRGRAPQNLPWLRKAVAADPAHAAAWFELGRTLIGAGDPAAAERAFTKALALTPGDADARRNLARLRLRLGDWQAAIEAAHGLPEDREVLVLRYRAACELGQDATPHLKALLSDAASRPEALTAMIRVAKGRIPLRLPELQAR